jgi:hypothetical protein
VFVLSSLGAPAQALDASTAYCVDDFFGGIIEQSTIPPQIVAPTIEKLGAAADEANGVTIAGPKDAANVPVEAIQPSDETRTVEYATGKGLGEAMLGEADSAASIFTWMFFKPVKRTDISVFKKLLAPMPAA